MTWGLQDLIVSGVAAGALGLLLRTLWRAGRRSGPCEHCPKIHAPEAVGGGTLTAIVRRPRP